ncbi:ankyrin repeat-containing domain protein [Aspergillus karnatakaensis]|uniref:ankyrin repeat domain-containing protein n=1 Tax=Aspergillus karnatakaensis TaxID=1810916 RepID=UPI003CCDF242
MDLSELPLELTRIIASYLDHSSINALIQTGKWFANGLTPHLYDRALQLRGYVKLRARPGGADRPRFSFLRDKMWNCIPSWSSCYIIDYFVQRRGFSCGSPPRWIGRKTSRVTPLVHVLAAAGNVDVLRAVISAGADVNATTAKYLHTPLHLAAMRGHERVIRCLLEAGADVLAESEGGSSVISAAAMNISSSTEAVLNQLIETTQEAGGDYSRPDNKQRTPLHLAALNGNEAAVRLLLEKGISP